MSLAVTSGARIPHLVAQPATSLTLALLKFDTAINDEVLTNTVYEFHPDWSLAAGGVDGSSLLAYGTGSTGQVFSTAAPGADDGWPFSFTSPIVGTDLTLEAWMHSPSILPDDGANVQVLLNAAGALVSMRLVARGTDAVFEFNYETPFVSRQHALTIPGADTTAGLVHVAVVIGAATIDGYCDGVRLLSTSNPESAGWSSLTLGYVNVGCIANSTFEVDCLRLSQTARYSGSTLTVPATQFTLD